MSEKKLRVTKVTLSTGKIVLLRELKISHSEEAAQLVSARSNGDINVLGIMMQKAMLQLLLFQIDGKTLTANQIEDLDSIFTIGEYGELLGVMGKIMGVDNGKKEPKLEFIAETVKQIAE